MTLLRIVAAELLWLVGDWLDSTRGALLDVAGWLAGSDPRGKC